MWIIEKTEGVVYDMLTYVLRTETGEKIASVYIGEKGLLTIALETDTNFISENGEYVFGYSGYDAHEVVRLHDRGGVLKYQSFRHSTRHDSEKEISIKIMMLEGDVVTSPYKKVATKNFFSDLCTQLKDLFGAMWGWNKKTV